MSWVKVSILKKKKKKKKKKETKNGTLTFINVNLSIKYPNLEYSEFRTYLAGMIMYMLLTL